jgi:crossover junction endodeoxyribonuclease RuvC
MAVDIRINRDPKKFFVGLDVATKAGYSILKEDNGSLNLVTTGVVKQGIVNKVKPQDHPLERAVYVANELKIFINSLMEENPSNEVVVGIEGYSLNSKFSLASMVEVGTVVRLMLLELGVETYEIPPTTLKKFITGKGNASKEQVMVAVYKRFGFEAPDNDQADAVGLAYAMAHLKNIKLDLPKTHTETLVKSLSPLERSPNFKSLGLLI